ncbi:MAG: hypothetical protein QOG65_2555 [Actinomycetota bacterium]|nr:hypothetical protein [Actinomycetota bacterium]
MPGAMPRPDHLLPRATRACRVAQSATARAARPVGTGNARRRVTARAVLRFARKHWHRLVVLTVIGVALTMSVLAVRPVLFAGSSPSTAPVAGTPADARAKALLRTALGGGRSLLAARHSYANITPSMLSARSYDVPVVAGSTSARVGEVSMRVAGSATLTLATAVDAGRCAFARDSASGTRFAIVATASCRAIAAPARGWRSS